MKEEIDLALNLGLKEDNKTSKTHIDHTVQLLHLLGEERQAQRGAGTGLGIRRGLEVKLGLALQPSTSSPMLVPRLLYRLCRKEEKYTCGISGVSTCAWFPPPYIPIQLVSNLLIFLVTGPWYKRHYPFALDVYPSKLIFSRS